MKKKHSIYLIEHPSRVGMFREQLKTQDQFNCILYTVPAIIKPNPSEGIALSHCSIVRSAKASGADRVIIAEDDCQFFSPLAMKHFLDNEPGDYDVYLGGLYAGSEKVTEDNRLVKFFCGLHLYMVHERFYDRFLSADWQLDSIDNALSRMARKGQAKIVACYPFAAVQRELVSNNTGCIFKHRAFFNAKNTLGFPEKTNT